MIDETNGNLSFNPQKEEIKVEENKKSKWKFIIGGFILVVVVAIGLFIGYRKLTSDPVLIYKNAINGIYDIISSNLNDAKKKTITIDLKNEPMVVSLDAKLDSSIAELKNFSGVNYSLKVGLDKKNEKGILGLGVNKDNKDILNVMLGLMNGNAYAKSSELFSRVINLGKYDFDDLNIDSYLKVNNSNINVTYDDLEYVLKEIKQILIDSLDANKFEVTDQAITIRNKKVNVKKVLYNLDKENMERTEKFIVDSILKNENLIASLAKLSGVSVDTLKDKLKETGYVGTDAKIVLYTDKFKGVVAGSLTVDNKEVLEFDYLDKLINTEIKDDSAKLNITESNEAFDIVYLEKTREVLNLKLYKSDTNIKVDYSMNIEGTRIKGSLEFNNISVNDTKSSGEFKFDINVEGEEKFDLALSGFYALEKTDVNFGDVSDSVKIEDIPEMDLVNIYTKLGEVLEEFGLTDLMGDMGSL